MSGRGGDGEKEQESVPAKKDKVAAGIAEDETAAQRIQNSTELRDRSVSRLREFSECMRKGGAPFRVIPKEPADFGTTVRGASAGPPCNHYLPANRFEWWDWYHENGIGKSELPHNAIISEEGEFQDEAINSIFCSNLATLVGSNLDEISGIRASKLSWDDLPDGASPNHLRGVEYSVRMVREGCVPRMRELVTGNRTSMVLVNCPRDQRPDPDQPPPPLTIEFTVPQRAVALEYGWWGNVPPGRPYIRAGEVIITAKDRYGEVISSCDGSEFYGEEDFSFAPMAETRITGICDRAGGIYTIEFKFLGIDQEILDGCFIRRMWHEPFPPSALKQGTIEMEFYGENDDRNRNAETTVRLPFNCDRYMIFCRGFRGEFLDEEQDIHGVVFHVDEKPALRKVDPRSICIYGSAGLMPHDSEGPIPFKGRIYYSVIAWDSSMMDVFLTCGTISGSLQETGSMGRVIVDDPSRFSSQWEAPGTDISGGVFGAIHFFRGWVTDDQTMEELFFETYDPYRTRRLPRSSRVQQGNQLPPEPGSENSVYVPSGGWSYPVNSTSLCWGMQCNVKGDDEGPNRWDMWGKLLAGFSVRKASGHLYVFASPPELRRSQREFYISPEFVSSQGWTMTLEGDMAFVGFSQFYLGDTEDVRSVDFEVKGHEYDGSRIIWKMGFEGAKDSLDSDDGFPVLAMPTFGALMSRRMRPSFNLSRQDIEFDDGIPGILSLAPSQFGFIRNMSNVPVMITGAELHGPDADSFYVILINVPTADDEGRTFPRHLELQDALPLQDFTDGRFVWLAPGDSLCIGGTFFPVGERTHQAWLEFRTNTPQDPLLVHISGTTTESRAVGNFFPDSYNFGMVEIGKTETRNALITADGATPLLITSLVIERDPRDMKARGFHMRGASIVEGVTCKQVQPGHSLPLFLSFRPIETGGAYAVLVAQTNAGELRMELRAEGVRL